MEQRTRTRELLSELTSISIVTPSGLLKLQRAHGVPNEPDIVEESNPECRSGWPVPLTPDLATPAVRPAGRKLHMQLLLTPTFIGEGRSGHVHEFTIDAARSSPELAALRLPPLVAKVSWEGNSEDLVHEVYYYDVLERLQGVVLPRCYGCFSGAETVDERCDWEPGLASQSEIRSLTGPTRTRMVSVLLLEKVGGVLPLGEEPPEGALEEIKAMYADLGMLGVDHVDIRWQNILYAPISPPGLPSLPSPFQNRAYRWRLVDFTSSVESNVDLESLVFSSDCNVRDLLKGIRMGYPPEPFF